MNLKYLLGSGKNSKLRYYTASFARYGVPKRLLRSRLRPLLEEIDRRPDRQYILDRADYYCKLSGSAAHPRAAEVRPPGTENSWHRLADHKFGVEHSAYFFDSYQYTRYFPDDLMWAYCFGDVTWVPELPSIVKSRPISDGGDNANSVLLNLDKCRHFLFLRDRKPFAAKRDMAIFRGDVRGKPGRERFMEMFRNNPLIDAGDTSPRSDQPRESRARLMTLPEHLDYKFIMALEGNDVASNLKWVMSTNSLAVMPRPTYETWYMEGRLEPGRHYVEVRPDYSDLEEQLRYYIAHPAEAERMAREANAWTMQFRDPRRERLISLLVLHRYFAATAQLPEL